MSTVRGQNVVSQNFDKVIGDPIIDFVPDRGVKEFNIPRISDLDQEEE